MYPRQLKIFTAQFNNVGDPDEELKVLWNDNGNPPLDLTPAVGQHLFYPGVDCFLEVPTNIQSVPDEHLISSLSMAAILAGEVLPGTAEYLNAVTEQGTKYFQTIVGNTAIEAIRLVTDTGAGPAGQVYDIDFKRVGTAGIKTVRTDAWSISQYDNRIASPPHSIYCVVGAIHKQFGFKKSQLGIAGSANRQAVIDFIENQLFWV